MDLAGPHLSLAGKRGRGWPRPSPRWRCKRPERELRMGRKRGRVAVAHGQPSLTGTQGGPVRSHLAPWRPFSVPGVAAGPPGIELGVQVS